MMTIQESTQDRGQNRRLNAPQLLGKMLSIVAIMYCVVFGAFAMFTFSGFSFVAKEISSFFNKASIILVFPTIAGLYVYRAKGWANFLLTASPIAVWNLPLPSEFSVKAAIMLAVTPYFFLPGTGAAKRWIAGPLVAMLAFFMVFTAVIGGLLFTKTDVRNHEHLIVSTSPDNRYVIEVTGTDLGPPVSIPTEAKLYYNYAGSPLKRMVRVLESNYSWPSKVKIKWLSNERVLINGKLFNINE